jgi:hypothetical protein
MFKNLVTRFGVFMAMKVEVMVFWVAKPCSVMVGYQHFGELCWLFLQG